MTDTSDYNKGGSEAKTDSVKPFQLPSSDLSRVLPRQLSTGSTRGTQTVGYGDTKIDGSNNTIRVGSTVFLDGNDGLITVGKSGNQTQGIGSIPQTLPVEAGFFQTDPTGKVIWKQVDGTAYTYNPQDNYNNKKLDGFAPDDGRPGLWIAKQGYSAERLLNAS